MEHEIDKVMDELIAHLNGLRGEPNTAAIEALERRLDELLERDLDPDGDNLRLCPRGWDEVG